MVGGYYMDVNIGDVIVIDKQEFKVLNIYPKKIKRARYGFVSTCKNGI